MSILRCYLRRRLVARAPVNSAFHIFVAEGNLWFIFFYSLLCPAQRRYKRIPAISRRTERAAPFAYIVIRSSTSERGAIFSISSVSAFRRVAVLYRIRYGTKNKRINKRYRDGDDDDNKVKIEFSASTI